MKLTCDDCGSIQHEANERCELCGGSLSEERDRKEKGSFALLLLAAIAATALLCVAPAFVIKFFWFPELSTDLFAAGYGAIWLVGILVGRFYTPKDNYDFGWRARGYGFVDNPFTRRDNYHRSHATVGIILLPMNIVGGLWAAVFASLFG